VQVPLRHSDEIRKSTVVVEDAEDGSIGAVGGPSGQADLTSITAAVDFSNDPAARQRARLDDANELVAKDAVKAHVSANQLQIGFTDARTEDPDHYFAVPKRRFRMIGASHDAVPI
jgi:hypothetical protein